MDLFDSDDDGEAPTGATAAAAMLNDAYIELMRIRPAVRKTITDDAALIYHREVLLFVEDSVESEGLQMLNKLEKAHFKCVKVVAFRGTASVTDHINSIVSSDVIVLMESSPCNGIAAYIGEYVAVGASVLSVCTESLFCNLYPSDRWITEKATRKPLSNAKDDEGRTIEFLSIRKRGVRVNPHAAIYWGKGDEDFLMRERQLVDDLTVNLSMAERRLGVFRFVFYEE
jgi:hypothetical protein